MYAIRSYYEKKLEEHRALQIEESFSRLTQGHEENTTHLRQQISQWQAFVNKYPSNNPYLEIATSRLNELKRSQEIENRYAMLQQLKEVDATLTAQLAEWRGFVEAYPGGNPHFVITSYSIHYTKLYEPRNKA